MKTFRSKEWKKFSKLKNGTPIKLRKKGDIVQFYFKVGKTDTVLLSFTEAEPGGGMMEWKEYKERTKKM